MSTRSNKAESAELLIGESFDAPDARLYVYRDDGSGRTEGKYLKRYDARIELEDLRRDLGPGMYILLQNRGPGGAIVRRSVFVPADPQTTAIETAPASSAGTRLDQLKEILEMKMIADQLAPRVADPIKMLEGVLGLVRGAAPADPLTAFLKGAEWNGHGANDGTGAADPASLLTAAGVRLLEQRVAGAASANGESATAPMDAGAVLKRIVIAFNQRFERTEQLIADLARSRNGAADPTPAPETEGSPAVSSGSLLEIFQALCVGQYETGEHVAIVLRTMDKAARGDLKKEITSYVLEDLLEHMKTGLESAGHGDRFESFSEGIRLFLR